MLCLQLKWKRKGFVQGAEEGNGEELKGCGGQRERERLGDLKGY